MAKILLTGGAGFIGSHVAEALLGRGDEVVVLDAVGVASVRESEENPASGVASGNAAYVIYTSGTTGFPKGAILSFRNLLTMAVNLMEVDPKRETDEFVSFLPLAWIGEQMMTSPSMTT